MWYNIFVKYNIKKIKIYYITLLSERNVFIMGLLNDTYLVTYTTDSKERIEELKKLHLPIIFADEPESYFDEVGGFHSCGLGYNPNDVFCGECSKGSCRGCKSKDVTKEEKERLLNG